MRKVWYHQIWIQNYLGFIVSDLLYIPIYNIIFASFINLKYVLLKIAIKIQKIMNYELPNWPKASQILDFVS